MVLLLLAILVGVPTAFARDDIVPGSRYTDARGAAMGDAYLPIPDDGAAALFYNPANIALLKRPQVEPLNIQTQANLNYMKDSGIPSADAYTLADYATHLKSHPDRSFGFGYGVLPNAFLKGIAFGLLYQNYYRASYITETNQYQYRTRMEMIPAGGVAVPLAGGIVRFGYSFQWVNTAHGTNLVDASQSSTLSYGKGLYQGSAFSHTGALALTYPIRFLPQINVVVRNIGDARYQSTTLLPVQANSLGAPDNEKMSMDLSFSIQPKIGGPNYLNLVAELRDAGNTSGVGVRTRLAFGGEFAFRDVFFLRAGMGGGWASAGLGLRRDTGGFQVAWYSEELSETYQGDRDIRYILQYQMRFF